MIRGEVPIVLGVFLSSRNSVTDKVRDSLGVLVKRYRGLAMFSTCLSRDYIRSRLSTFCRAINPRSRILLYDSLCNNDIGRTVFACLSHPGAQLIDNIGVDFVVGILDRSALDSRQLSRVVRRDHRCLHHIRPRIPTSATPTNDSSFF